MNYSVAQQTNTIFDLLRLSEEPCEYYSEAQIHSVLINNINDFMNFIERFYIAYQKDHTIVVQPKKLVFQTRSLSGDFRVMPCIIDGFEGKTIKVVKIIGTNEEEQIVSDKICVGKSLLINTTDNFVEGIFDVCALSSFRTAAISVLAFKHTTNVNSARIGIIGTGRIGFYTACILESWLGVKTISIYDESAAMQDSFCGSLSESLRIDKRSKKDLCHHCNSLFLSTNSKEPIINRQCTQQVSFISSVGADADNLSELESDLLLGRRLVSESKQNAYFGDLDKWRSKGLLETDQIFELRDFVSRKRNHFPTLFISTGCAVQDALSCHFVKEKLTPNIQY